MTEAEWLNRVDPGSMLKSLQEKVSNRKLRLFAVACCKQIIDLITDRTSLRALEVAERFADGMATEQERAAFSGIKYYDYKSPSQSNCLTSAVSAVGWAVARPLTITEADHCRAHANHAQIDDAAEKGLWIFDGTDNYMELTRPFREKSNHEHSALLRDIFGNPFRPVTLDPRWQSSTVLDLARTIYDKRTFEHMPILADALMDAGCDNEAIIQHCQGPGPHVRGCWVVDLLTGRE